MKAVLGPYPPRFGGTELRAMQEFKEGPALFIGTSHAPKTEKNLILIKKRRFLIDCPLMLIKIAENRKKINKISAHYATTFGFVARIAKLIFGIPYTVTCHGSDILLNLKRPFLRLFTMSALRHADSIIVVSKKLKEVIIKEKFNPGTIKVDIAKIDEKEFRKLKVKKKDQMIFVGKVQYTKGVDLLINAFARISQKYPKYKLVIAGDFTEPQYYDKLKKSIQQQNIQNKVIFLGNTANIPLLLNKSKLFICHPVQKGGE